jgi:hypothetical protein
MGLQQDDCGVGVNTKYASHENAGQAQGPSGDLVQCNCLVQQREVVMPVLLPTSFIGFSAYRFFLAVADGLECVGARAALGQCLAGCIGALFTQRQVVFG